MRKALITGITGFAGSHLAELLVAKGGWEVYGTSISDRHVENIVRVKDSIQLHTVNLLDSEATEKVIVAVRPDVIFHLAAATPVAESFRKPAEVITNNVTAQVNIFEATRKHDLLDTKIIVTSSPHVYGNVPAAFIPINETAPFAPDNPYSVSKIAQDYLALQYYLAYKQSTIRLRPFNHCGPRLSPDISLSRFAKTIAEIEKGKKEPVIRVGPMTTKRDFTDVSDMVRAYVLAVDHCQAGEAYNIGSGVSHTMQEMLDKLLSFSTVHITVESDPSLFRPSDIQELRADASKFEKATGWKPEVPIEKTLENTLNYWREQTV